MSGKADGIERKTGKRTKRKFHSQKADESITRLKKRLSSGKLSDQEKKIARALIDDLGKALSS